MDNVISHKIVIDTETLELPAQETHIFCFDTLLKEI
jgi:hypothetical protein